MIATPEFSRPLAVDKIGPGGVQRTVEASPAECAALAERFRVPAILSLSCDFSLRRGADTARGEIFAEGLARAVVARVCVVSLEEFEQPMAETFRVRLVRAGTESDDVAPEEEEDEVPYEGAAIDLGEIAAEQVALALDPYPRCPGAQLPDAAREERESPFAALRRSDPR